MENELNKTSEALKNFIRDYWRNTFDFFYEEDIRAGLYAKLKENISTLGEYKFDGQFSLLKNFFKFETFKSSIVKTEYPYSNDSRKRFDLVILDNSSEDFYRIPTTIGIEIKIASEETKVNNVTGFIENIKSLSKYGKSRKEFCGIALYFYQTKLEEPEKYFNSSNLEEMSLNDLSLKRGIIYAFIITGDKKIFGLKNFTQNIV